MQKVEEIRATGTPSSKEETESGQSALQKRTHSVPGPETPDTLSDGTTPCPACTLTIDIDTNRCPHCSSDVSAHMALLRERVREQRDSRSPWKKIAGYISDPAARRDLRVVAPTLLVVFGLIATLRLTASAPVIWAAAPLCGICAHLLLKRAGIARTIHVDIYRVALLLGLAALLGGALL